MRRLSLADSNKLDHVLLAALPPGGAVYFLSSRCSQRRALRKKQARKKTSRGVKGLFVLTRAKCRCTPAQTHEGVRREEGCRLHLFGEETRESSLMCALVAAVWWTENYLRLCFCVSKRTGHPVDSLMFFWKGECSFFPLLRIFRSEVRKKCRGGVWLERSVWVTHLGGTPDDLAQSFSVQRVCICTYGLICISFYFIRGGCDLIGFFLCWRCAFFKSSQG